MRRILTVVSVAALVIVFSQSAVDAGKRKRKPCNVSAEEAADILQELFLIGDNKLLLPSSHGDIDKHCAKIEKRAKRKVDHLKCLDAGSAKLVFTTLTDGFLAENKRRCSNNEWREKFLNFSKCARKKEAKADVHQCGYKLHDAFNYSLNNFKVDHQLQFACCAMKNMDACLHAAMVKDCGKDVAEYAVQLFWEPVNKAFTVSCPKIASMDQCREMYPKAMKDVDEIFASTKILEPRNFMKPGYQLHEDRGSEEPKFVGKPT